MPDAATTGFTATQVATLVATSSVLAALLTQGLAWLREWLGETKHGKFAALYIATALEGYARVCWNLIVESSAAEGTEGVVGAYHNNLAELPAYPEVDWKAFGIKSTEEAMAFRVEIDSERMTISGWWEHDDPEVIVPHVREKSAEFALKALRMAKAYRKARGLTALDQSDAWSIENRLQTMLKEHVKTRESFEAEQAKSSEQLFAETNPPT